MLGVAGGFSSGAGLSIVASQQMKQVRAFELHRGIGFAFFINEQWEGDARFPAKSASIDAVAKSNGCQCRTAVSEGLFVSAQLRDMLAAEDSTVMAQESYDRWLAHPQRTKADFFAVYVRQGNHRKATIEGAVHALPILKGLHVVSRCLLQLDAMKGYR